MKIRNHIILVLIAIISITFFASNEVLAYDAETFSIDIPEGYITDNKDSFTDATGRNINVTILHDSKTTDYKYSEEELNAIVSELDKAIDDVREQYVESLKSTYGEEYAEEIYKQVVETIKINSFLKKEITTVGKGNYKCYHIITEYSFMDTKLYMNQYTTNNGEDLYTLTLSAFDPSDFDTDELKNVVNSFEIKDTKTEESKPANTLIAKEDDSRVEEIEEATEESIDEVPNLISEKEETSIFENEYLPIICVVVILIVGIIVKVAIKGKKPVVKNENDDNNDSPIK